jgi:hypothetical protein
VAKQKVLHGSWFSSTLLMVSKAVRRVELFSEITIDNVLNLDKIKNMTATIIPNEIEVIHTVCGDREFLCFGVPNGWDDVKGVCKKVLEFEGRKFVFSCWNSDRLTCHFVRLLDGSTKTATIKKK